MTESGVQGSEGAEPSSSLLQRVRAHDQAAWERLVSLYSPLIARWCRQTGIPSADVPDVGQEVFQAVARKVGDFRREQAGDTFCGWVRIITRNKALDRLRRQRDEAVAVGGSDALLRLQQLPQEMPTDADGSADVEERGLLYARAVDLIRSEFEERTWRAFCAVVLDGRPPADVAADLGVSANVVYLAKSRVLRRLREEFADLLDL